MGHIPGLGYGEIPNTILFIQHLPTHLSPGLLQTSLTTAFAPLPGFREVRLVPGKADIAFIEFGTEVQAAMAKHTLKGQHLQVAGEDGKPVPLDTPVPLDITFAKK